MQEEKQNDEVRKLPDDLGGDGLAAASIPEDGAQWLEILRSHFENLPTANADRVAAPFDFDALAAARIDANTEFTPPPCALYIDGVRVCSMEDISIIQGGAKVKKTLFAAILANFFQTGAGDIFTTDLQGLKLLYFDTEQTTQHARNTYDRITNGAPPEAADRLFYIATREFSPYERLRALCAAIDLYRPDFVIADGVADLVTDTNSNTESPALVGVLMALAKVYGCHICGVLHTSAANTSKGRGHLGSEFERKCETVFLVKRDGDDPTGLHSIIEAQYTRNRTFCNLRIAHEGDRGHTMERADALTACKGPDYEKSVIEAVKNCAAATIGKDHPDTPAPYFTQSQLAAFYVEVCRNSGRGNTPSDRTANTRISAAARNGWLTECEGDGNKRAKYYTFDDWRARRDLCADDGQEQE